MPELVPIWEVRNTMLDVVQLLRQFGLPGPAECKEVVDKLERVANAHWIIGVPQQ